MIKYLYGRKRYLEPIVEGFVGFRFSDISHYSRMENDEMRDSEMRKEFLINKNEFDIVVNGHKLDSKNITSRLLKNGLWLRLPVPA